MRTVAPEISSLGGVRRMARSVWRYDINSEILPYAQDALKLLSLTGRGKQRDRQPSQAVTDAVVDRFRHDNRLPSEYGDNVEFAYLTAMRIGEIYRLDWRDYEASARTILVRDRQHPP